MAQASPRSLRMVAGRLARLDPILSRSLMLAGFGLGLMALGRALCRQARGGRDTHSDQSDHRCGHSDTWAIPTPADDFPPN